ncbi:MAG: internal scaffolding protein [Microvirus sp.]|nr:MAG: internal scaffolding protein [Microvirus sp.]
MKNTTDKIEPLRSFYHPHRRVTVDPHVMDRKTGEFKIPARRTKQSHLAECDINTIMKQYSQTGQIKHISAQAQAGRYLDLPDNIDFQEAMNIIRDGENAFASLPSKTRDRFGNDPANFLEFMADPHNAPEAIKMGLATKSETQPPAGPLSEPETKPVAASPSDPA